MLEQDDAERLLGLCQAQIESYANPRRRLTRKTSSFSPSRSRHWDSSSRRSSSSAPTASASSPRCSRGTSAETPAPQEDVGADTVEDAVEDLRGLLPQLLAEIRRAPADAAARAVLMSQARRICVDDATLIDDSELVVQAQEALA